MESRGRNQIGQREMLAVMKSHCKPQGTQKGALELGRSSRVVLSWGSGLGLYALRLISIASNVGCPWKKA